MFGFMKKKDPEEKERKKKEKKEKKDKKKSEKPPLTSAELHRLEDIKRSLAQQGIRGTGVDMHDGGAVPYMGNDSSESSSLSSGRPSAEDVSVASTNGQQPVVLTKPNKPPPISAKPHISKPKRGILKGRSHYGPEIPNHGVRGNLDDTITLEQNTVENELRSGELPPVKSPQTQMTISELRHMEHRHGHHNHGHAVRTGSPSKSPVKSPRGTTSPRPNIEIIEPPPESPLEKTFENVDLKLPNLAPPKQLKNRTVTVQRQPAGDFGFTLRKGSLRTRSKEGAEHKVHVVFAEPSISSKGNETGLLPGDRLLEVNGNNVENKTRDDIINLIRETGHTVELVVQPVPELSELSTRSGVDGKELSIDQKQVMSGTLKRSGSIRFKKGVRFRM